MARKPKLDAHAKAVAEANKILKELDRLLNFHEAIVAAMETRFEPPKRRKKK